MVLTLLGRYLHKKLLTDYTQLYNIPDLDKTWDAQNYVLRELKSGRSPN